MHGLFQEESSREGVSHTRDHRGQLQRERMRERVMVVRSEQGEEIGRFEDSGTVFSPGSTYIRPASIEGISTICNTARCRENGEKNIM